MLTSILIMLTDGLPGWLGFSIDSSYPTNPLLFTYLSEGNNIRYSLHEEPGQH